MHESVEMRPASGEGSGGRLWGYVGILGFLGALLYREAALERNLGSVPVLLVCLAGASHVLCGFAWRHVALSRVFRWSRWLFIILGAFFSIRLLVPINYDIAPARPETPSRAGSALHHSFCRFSKIWLDFKRRNAFNRCVTEKI